MQTTGRIKDGAIVPDGPLNLPEGTRVEIRTQEAEIATLHPDVQQLMGMLKGDASDMAEYYEHVRKKHA